MSLENSGEKFNLDLLIQQIGPFGKFQLMNYLLICIPITLTGFYALTFVFTTSDLNYRCRIPGCDGDNPSLDAPFLDLTTPKDGDKFSSCQKFLHTPNASVVNQCQADLFSQSEQQECSEFVYEDEEKTSTILSEWDLGCKDEWKLSLVGTMSQIGLIIGQPLSGYFSDKYGRRTIFIFSALVSAILGLSRSFSTSYTMFIVLEFLNTAVGSGTYNSGFILGMELVGPSRRSLGVFFINVFYAIGEALLGPLAMLTKNWRLLLRITYAPSLLILIYRWLIPESVKWLASMKRPREAAKVIDSAAKMNKSELTPEARDMLSKAFCEDPESEIFIEKEKTANGTDSSLLAAFKSRILLFRLLNCLLCWFSIYFVFLSLTMNSVAIVGNKYVSFMLVCLVEIPAGGLCCFAMDKLGRRLVVCISLILSGIACIAYIFAPSDITEGGHLAIFLFGKFSITMALITIYVYTAELFPTKLRLTFLSICATFGNLGSTLAPFTLLLGKYFESLPMILFAAVAIPAGLLILLAPETLNHNLPDTIQDAENIGKKSAKTAANSKYLTFNLND